MRTWQEYINLAPILCMVLTVSVQVLSGNQSGRHTYVVRYKHGDSLIPVTVVLDYKRQTEYVINMNSRSPAKSMTLYDFKERVIAYKDLKNGECFIGRLIHETIQDEDAVLKRLKNPVESQPLILTLEPDRPSLTPTEVRNMAGHKAAVFCRRMNTWTLMPQKDNKRKRRDTSRHLDRFSAHDEDHRKNSRAALQRTDVFKTEQDNSYRNRSHRDFSSFQSNGSFSIPHRTASHPEAASSLQASILETSTEHQGSNSIYPFILPRQRSSVANKEERSGSRQDGSIQRFPFAQETSDVQALSGFFQSRPSGSENGTSLISSTKHSFIPLKANHPVIIPTISFPSKSSESKLPENHGVNHMHSHDVLRGIYPQSVNNFNVLHNRDEAIGSYPPFHRLPPEAFVLPLTRSSAATTAQPFIFNNRLGYEIVHLESQSSHNDSDLLTGLNGSLSKSVGNFKSILTARSDHSARDLHQSSISSLDNPKILENTQGVPLRSRNHTWREENEVSVGKGLNQPSEKKSFYVDVYAKQAQSISPDKSSNETQKSHNEVNTSSVTHFDNSGSSSTDRSDSPIQVPRWYPEIAKQISIPLEIEVLHHQEEYTHGVTNRTEEVHSVRGYEIEDLSSLPSVNTIIPIPVEGHSNGIRFEKEVKLLPQVSGIPDDDSSKGTIRQTLGRQGEKVDARSEPTEFRVNSYPIYKGTSNTSLPEILRHAKPTPGPLLTNDTEIVDSIRSLSISSVPISGVSQNSLNQISHPTPSRKRIIEESRHVPRRQHQINEGSLAVQDFKIHEGVPSYRKRFPAVSQLFTPDETVADVGRVPDQHIRLSQQSPHTRRRPSAVRNKTHGIPLRGYESKSVLRKHNLRSRNLINGQQTRFSDQGITFHQRGYAKPGVSGVPYYHHRKRLGILPPGVSVHPRHPQAPYADLATETADKTIPVNPLLHRPRRVHHRRHQRKRNRIEASLDSGLSGPNCCSGGDGHNCCSSRRRGRHFSNGGCCSQHRESRRPNLVLPPQTNKNEISSTKKVEVAEDRCMKEKMCRTVYQSTKKVLVCRNITVEGC